MRLIRSRSAAGMLLVCISVVLVISVSRRPAVAGERAMNASSDAEPRQASAKFDGQVPPEAAMAALAAAGFPVISTILELNVFRVRFPDGVSAEEAHARLRSLAGVVRVEPVIRLREQFHPNDPLYNEAQSYLPALLNAEPAWDIQQGDPRIVVAVIDSGVDITHPDLTGRIWTNPGPGHSSCGIDLHGCNFVQPGDVDVSCPAPSRAPVPNPDISPNFWHGTFVAGVLGAATNNGTGIAGVVPHATIMPVKVGDCIGPMSTALASGILYAAHNGAQIINLSVGVQRCMPAPADVLDAVAVAEQAGALVVAASGDDETPCVSSPANAPGVLAVGSVSASGSTRARFSQWGPEVAVVAPGTNIQGTVPPGGFPRSAGLYASSDGTSFSAPMVAGLADLLLSQNALLTPLLLRRLIQRGATPLSENGQPGWAGAGRIDLLQSLRLVPGAYYGRVRSPGPAITDGMPVVGRIGNQVCGQGLTTAITGGVAYQVFVQPDAAQPGCGVGGANVRFSVGTADAGSAQWGAGATPLDLAIQGASAPDSTTTFDCRSGWNLVAGVPAAAVAMVAGPLFTIAAGDSAYEVIPAGVPAEAQAGYWVYCSHASLVQVPLSQSPATTLRVPAGHFVLAGNSDTGRTVALSGVDVAYSYDSTQGRYVETSTLGPGQAAWVYSRLGGTLSLR